VVHVDENSPASRAGVEAGDVLLELGGREVDDGRELQRAVRDAEAGEVTTLRVSRRGEERTLEITLEERRPESPHAPAGETL
jgi:serine protease Do